MVTVLKVPQSTGRGWTYGALAGWRGNGPPRRDTAQTPTGGSSREFSAMGETLTEQRRVKEEGFRIVNFCYKGRTAATGNGSRVTVLY